MTPAETLISRLEHVRQYDKGWRADCPVGHRSKGTLSIGEGDDSRVLLRCFAGCDALDVVHAVGLELKDLFEERPTEHSEPRTPKERREARERARMYKVRRLLPELAFESRVVLAAAGKIEHDEPLTHDDRDRLVVAVQRIEQAREMLR
jgi:hypothetical protein